MPTASATAAGSAYVALPIDQAAAPDFEGSSAGQLDERADERAIGQPEGMAHLVDSRPALERKSLQVLGDEHEQLIAKRLGESVVDEPITGERSTRQALRDGYVSGGTRRNLAWVSPFADLARSSEDDALVPADAQTSGGLLVADEVPGYPIIGELIQAAGDGQTIIVT